MDLAYGHVCAANYSANNQGWIAINLGTGIGYSVLDIIRAYEKACGKPIAYQLVERRPGDVAANWADPKLAKELLGWEAKLTLQDMCESSWKFQQSC